VVLVLCRRVGHGHPAGDRIDAHPAVADAVLIDAHQPPNPTMDDHSAEHPRPAILAVDDEAVVLAAVSRDLRSHYGEHFRILRAGSGDDALTLLRELRRRGDQLAMIISDQRMPGMEGTEFLVQAREIYPAAKRLLLTAYADSQAAIVAINEAALDYYLLKPWDPPDEKLFPVVDDELRAWKADDRMATGGVRVIGHRFSRDAHDLRDFLAGNRVPGGWLDVERDREEAQQLLVASQASDERLPVVILEDGAALIQPSVHELAERLGVAGTPATDHYDLVIVGGGPAGLAAAVYGASEGLNTVMIEREAPGGQAGQSSRIENYLGFPAGLSGSDLARRATTQARRLGAELLTVSDAVALRVEGAGRIVELTGGVQLSANCVLVASGVSYRRMPAPGFDDFIGAGIYYGSALSEARDCQNQHVVIIGGANSAGQAAVHFSQFADRVTMLCRAESLAKSMSHYLIEQINCEPKIEVLTGTEAVAAEGNGHLERLRLRGPEGDESSEKVDACFVFIGALPRTDWLDGVVARDRRGFILAGPDAREHGWPLAREPRPLETSVPGVFVAGDVRARSIKRVASAVGEGSMAVSLIHEYLAEA
jgi:thioredoxin reductase (NADPH)